MNRTHSRLQSMADDARDRLDDVMSAASDGSRRAARSMSDAAHQATGMISDRATRQIHDYPLTTVFAAAVLGLFTGFLMSRR